VLLIAAAVVLNVVLFSDQGEPVDPSAPSGGDVTNEGGDAAVSQQDGYFSATQVSRQRARDEALEVLQNVIDNESADGEAKAAAMADIAQMAKDMESEANVETLVMAKGFAQCVAVIGGDSISVVVDVDSTLNASQIAQINTIVYEQTGITPEKIVIIEK
jgi:stage III sporulation protein AH